MTLSKLTEGLRHTIEEALDILEYIDSNEYRLPTVKQGIKRCYQEILCEKVKASSRRTSTLDFMTLSTCDVSRSSRLPQRDQKEKTRTAQVGEIHSPVTIATPDYVSFGLRRSSDLRR